MQESAHVLEGSFFHEPQALESMPSIVFDPKPLLEAFTFLSSFSFALLILIMVTPVLLLCALLIKLISGGPIFFKQRRLGKNGKVFWIWKFRTMIVDAEAGTGPVLSSRHDPRVTSIGKILRNSHLDELPQILNVIRGEMAFVGPRPERPEFLGKILEEVPHFSERHAVRPGITGLAQVLGSYDLSPREKLQYDLHWIRERHSFRMNFFVLIETFKKLFNNRFNL